MTCKQIDELLPLYAGRDLDEKRARLVSEHVEICSACARVAAEYREAFELTQHFAPPVFSANAYASVRRQVMQQIEAEPTGWYARLRRASRPEAGVPAPLLPQMFSSWFRPRMAWAVATALVIAFGFALYLVVKRPGHVQPVAENHPAVNEQPGSQATLTTTSPGTMQTPAEDKRRRRNFVNRSPLMAAKAPNSSSREAAISPKLRDPAATSNLPAVDPVPGESPLRVEIQTKDPNIRIIWFSQSNSKPALPNSKGT